MILLSLVISGTFGLPNVGNNNDLGIFSIVIIIVTIIITTDSDNTIGSS